MDYKKIYLDSVGEYESIHHIDLNHTNSRLNNLISLDAITHARVHQYIEDKKSFKYC